MKRAIELVARALASDERDAVLGDLAECGDPPIQAFFGVLGLVIRRHAALWMHWRPWLALGLAILAGITFGAWSSHLASLSAIYSWLYANNWDWALWHFPGFRRQIGSNAAAFAFAWACMILAAWLMGGLLRWTSRTTKFASAGVFMLLLFAVRPDPVFARANLPVFALWFYRIAFPLMAKTVLVMLPCWQGMRTRRIA